MKATDLLKSVVVEDENYLTLLEATHPLVQALNIKAEDGFLYFTGLRDKEEWKVPLDRDTRTLLNMFTQKQTPNEGWTRVAANLQARLMRHQEIETAKERTSFQPRIGPKPDPRQNRNVRDMSQQQIQQAGNKFQLESKKSSVNPKSLTIIKGIV